VLSDVWLHFCVDANGSAVQSQVLAVSPTTQRLQAALVEAQLAPKGAAATHELVFEANMPPVGYATFAIMMQNSTTVSGSNSLNSSSSNPTGAAAGPDGNRQTGPDADLMQAYHQLSTGAFNVTVDVVSGRLVAVSAADGSWAMALTQEMMWYKSSTGGEEDPLKDGPARAQQSGRRQVSRGRRCDHCDGADSSGSPAGCMGGTSSTAAGAVGCSSRDGRLLRGSQSSGAYIFRPATTAPVSYSHLLLCWISAPAAGPLVVLCLWLLFLVCLCFLMIVHISN